MKLIFCVSLGLILSNFNVKSSILGMVEKLEKFNENDYKTKFTDLNADCLFLILARLNLADLLNVAQIDHQSTAVIDVYHHKYSKLRVELTDNFPFPVDVNELMTGAMKIGADTLDRIYRASFIPNKTPDIKEYEYEIEIGDYVGILNTFKHFGHLIKRLKCRTYPWTSSLQTELIGYLISEYSSESLVDIELVRSPDKLLKYITKPLINVENVTFSMISLGFEPPRINFGELFPAVRRLNMDSLSQHELANFDYHMPHLEHISMKQSNRNSSPVPGVISKNPQIRSIHLNHVESEFVQNVNALLPQLETLKLSFLILQNGSIQFKNVIKLEIDNVHFTSPTNLHFPRLQTIHIDYGSERFAEYRAFLNEHNHLSSLHLTHQYMDDSQFQQITENLNDLVIVTLKIKCTKHDSLARPNAIVEFLRSHDKVKQLNVINYHKNWIVELQERLKHKWNIRDLFSGLSFERK